MISPVLETDILVAGGGVAGLAETAAFADLLGVHVQRLATIARGDAVCTTHVPEARVPHSARTAVPAVPTTIPTNPAPLNRMEASET